MAHSTMVFPNEENVDKQAPPAAKRKNLLKDPLGKEHPLVYGSTLILVVWKSLETVISVNNLRDGFQIYHKS